VLYRSALGVLLVVAVLLTLNERSQEDRARRGAESTPPASRLPPEGQRPPVPYPPPSSAAQAETARPSVPYPPPPYPPPVSATFAPTTPLSEAYPPPSADAPAPGARPPFAQHQVRLRRDTDLLRAPEPGAVKVEPLGHAPAGTAASALDERDGWYLLDTGTGMGWAPLDAVEEP
jgi:hypothetical protein